MEPSAYIDSGWAQRVLEKLPATTDPIVLETFVEHSQDTVALDADGVELLAQIIARAPDLLHAEEVYGDVMDLLNETVGSAYDTDVHLLDLTKACAHSLFNADPERFRESFDDRLCFHMDGPEDMLWADEFWRLVGLPQPRVPQRLRS
jgi:hypothetical protein